MTGCGLRSGARMRQGRTIPDSHVPGQCAQFGSIRFQEAYAATTRPCENDRSDSYQHHPAPAARWMRPFCKRPRTLLAESLWRAIGPRSPLMASSSLVFLVCADD